MSYDTKNDTITVAGVTYDVERSTNRATGAETLTLERDGEPVFEGIEGTLGYDDEPGVNNPREWSNVGTMFVDYSGYNLGDEDAPDPREQEVECPVCEDGWVKAGSEHAADKNDPGDEDGDVTCGKCGGAGTIELDLVEYLRTEHGARVVMPLYVYEHSGITIRAGSPIPDKLTREAMRSSGRFVGDDAGWDTSFVGFTFDTPERVKECIGEDATDEQIEAALDAEVKVYASYLEGDVTYWSVEDDETNFNEGCGGYVGDSKHCESECFSALEDAIECRLAENAERADMAARDIITI